MCQYCRDTGIESVQHREQRLRFCLCTKGQFLSYHLPWYPRVFPQYYVADIIKDLKEFLAMLENDTDILRNILTNLARQEPSDQWGETNHHQ
jgi:hypothetical protein